MGDARIDVFELPEHAQTHLLRPQDHPRSASARAEEREPPLLRTSGEAPARGRRTACSCGGAVGGRSWPSWAVSWWPRPAGGLLRPHAARQSPLSPLTGTLSLWKRWSDPVSQIQQRHRSGLVHVEESQVEGR